ncbi:3862_t:CDS:1 [Cetraspora pellucida]|uniref:3862_t:CDS:1 n=1 Tax=Cetraspora pellucida TaxID=1433469 RepID=A0ACA9K788_9GLOM|nr:3862_t:CDS:1 [Cetraspora pellucida]
MNDDTSLSVEGRPAYIGPECYLHPDKMIIGDKFDIYSLGMVLWALTSGTSPFQGLSEDDIISNHLRRQSEKVKGGTPVDYIKIYQSCWQSEPEKRPSLNEILIELKKLRSTLI